MHAQIKKIIRDNLKVGEYDSFYVNDLGYQVEELLTELAKLGFLEKSLTKGKVFESEPIKVNVRESVYYLEDIASHVDEWVGTYHLGLRNFFLRQSYIQFFGSKNNVYISEMIFRSLLRSVKWARKTHTSRFSKRMKPSNRTKKGDEFCAYWAEQLGYSTDFKNGSFEDYDLLHNFARNKFPSIEETEKHIDLLTSKLKQVLQN